MREDHKMMRNIAILLLLVMIILPGLSESRSIKAYFNSQEATVTGVVLHKGERFSVNLTVTPDTDSFIYVFLTEPGVTQAYELVDGRDKGNIENRKCQAGATTGFSWDLVANGNWAGGDAPLNIYYQINDQGMSDNEVSGCFTVVDAYISPQNDATATNDHTDQPSEAMPGITALAAIAITVTVGALSRKKGLR